VFTRTAESGIVVAAILDLKQITADLSAGLSSVAQTALAAAGQFSSASAERGEAKKVRASREVSRPAQVRGSISKSRATVPRAGAATPPLDSHDVVQFRQELEALRRYMNQMARGSEPNATSAPGDGAQGGGVRLPVSLQQYLRAAGEPLRMHEALTSAVRLLQSRAKPFESTADNLFDESVALPGAATSSR
jgi:hypothetical protein